MKNTSAFREALHSDSADFVTLTSKTMLSEQGARPQFGWCTYNNTIQDSPEVEIMAGGLNEKTPDAAAVWRQGNLLEFGFELSPQEMNETGRALLFNAIVYISKFSQDRPILRVPMTEMMRLLPRRSLMRLLADEKNGLNIFENYLTREAIAAAPGKNREEYLRWLPTVLPYFHPDATIKYSIDREAQSLGIAADQADFPRKTIALLRSDGARSETARILLERYIPEGPGVGASPDAWERWVNENERYMFFSESGGLRWYIDPLAQKRRIPTAKLRGPARADIPGKSK